MQIKRKVYTVSSLTHHIKGVLQDEVGHVWVEGEISNFKLAGSGHAYFTLKDRGASLNVALFAGVRAAAGGIELNNGQQLRLYGEISVYPQHGNYQLIVRKIERIGDGDLMARFLALKAKLEAEGLFAPERKRKLPLLPQRIGIVTSPSGSVIRDMLRILLRRYPNLQIRLAPVKVQGDGAAAEICAALELFNRHCGSGSGWPADLLIVGRGGGSLEELWAFNEEAVARAVAASRIPVIAAVGHQTDFLLAEFAADLRAATPSEAAEIAVRVKSELAQELARQGWRLQQSLRHRMGIMEGRLATVRASRFLRQPTQIIESFGQRRDLLAIRLTHAARAALKGEGNRVELLEARRRLICARALELLRTRLEQLAQQLAESSARALERARHNLNGQTRDLNLLSPLAVLERGYSLTRDAQGRLVRSVDQVALGAPLVTQLSGGIIHSTVDAAERTNAAQ